MTAPKATLMRCERCRAVISNSEASDMIRHGVPCGVCGGKLTLCSGQRGGAQEVDGNDAGA